MNSKLHQINQKTSYPLVVEIEPPRRCECFFFFLVKLNGYAVSLKLGIGDEVPDMIWKGASVKVRLDNGVRDAQTDSTKNHVRHFPKEQSTVI